MRHTKKLLYEKNTIIAEYLATPLNKLPFRLSDGMLGKAIRRVKKDLNKINMSIKPSFYMSTEYGCCENTINISVPFWDTSTILRELVYEYAEIKYSYKMIVLNLRHECGHAFCYAYKLYKDKEFRRLFNVKGSFFKGYPKNDRYKHNPWSKNYVNLAGDYYAQKHPDDDFAETFAAWLTNTSNWKTKYKNKSGALKKLNYVQKAVKKYKRKTPLITIDYNDVVEPIDYMNFTLAKYLSTKGTKYKKKATGYIDEQLKKIFSKTPGHKYNKAICACKFISQNQKSIAIIIMSLCGAKKMTVYDLIYKIKDRTKALNLYVKKKDQKIILNKVITLISTLSTTYMIKKRYFL